jgi:hypothetical protein
VDGGDFGGYVKPANFQEDRIDRRFARNQNGKRKVCRYHPRARGELGSSRVPFRKPSFRLYSRPYCQVDRCSRR